MLSSLSLFKNPIFRHSDRRASIQVIEQKISNSSSSIQPRHGGRELPKLNEANHSRSMQNTSTHVRDESIPSEILAPSTTVGTIASNDSFRTNNNSNRLSSNNFSPEVPFEVDSDVDRELGYSAGTIINYWRTKEKTSLKNGKYDPSASYVPQRRYMVDWISEIGEELRLQPITIHSAISLLDHVYACTIREYDSKSWRLQAICCLSIASKYEEAERNMPMVSEMALAAEMRLTTSMVTQEEHRLSKSMGWVVSRVTAMHFLNYYLHQGVTFPTDQCQGRVLISKVIRYMKKYVEFFANLCQQDYSFQRHLPSTIAASSILAARRALCIQPLWRNELETLTQCSANDINECATEVWSFYESMFPTHQPLRSSNTTDKACDG